MYSKHSKNSSQEKSWDIKTLIFSVTLLCAVIPLGYLLVFYIPSIKNNGQEFKKQYPMLNPSAALIHKDDLLVDFQSLRDSLTRKYEKHPNYLISLYFEYLPTGANISLNKDEKMWPASLIKIPVAMAIMKKIEKGDWKLLNELVILDEDKDSDFGELYKEPTGTTITIEDLLRKDLINSDNTAHFIFLRNLESAEVKDIFEHLGLDDVLENFKKTPTDEEALDNRITAKRYSIFFRSLYNSTYLLPEYSQMFLSILEGVPREYLNKELPASVPFAHKTGMRSDEAVYADSGIVYTPNRPYLFTVMVQKRNKKEASYADVEKIFTDISREIYDYVSMAK